MAEEQRRLFFFPSRQVSVVANTLYEFFPFIIIIIICLKNIHTEYITHIVHPGIQFMHCRQPDRQTIHIQNNNNKT